MTLFCSCSCSWDSSGRCLVMALVFRQGPLPGIDLTDQSNSLDKGSSTKLARPLFHQGIPSNSQEQQSHYGLGVIVNVLHNEHQFSFIKTPLFLLLLLSGEKLVIVNDEISHHQSLTLVHITFTLCPSDIDINLWILRTYCSYGLQYRIHESNSGTIYEKRGSEEKDRVGDWSGR